MLYNTTSIAYNHYTDIYSLLNNHIYVQDTGFVERSHEESDCDLICTAGEHNFLRFWSFKRPNKQGVGAALMGRGHTTGRKMEVPRT